MFLQALDTIHVSSVSSDNIVTGQTFEIDDLGGRSLIERGLAIEVDGAAPISEPAKAETAPVTEPEGAADEQPPIANKAGANTRTKAG
jgi:hypothetical protein